MQALILAGGEGTRLRPLTSTLPKPVVPFVDRPFIAYMLEWLRRHGVDDVIMSCGFLADRVRHVLGEGDEYGLRIRYVEEPEPLGTGGALKYAEALLEDRFLMLNGDSLTDLDLTAQIEEHERTGAAATLALVEVDNPANYGLVRLGAGGVVTEFVEKPASDGTWSLNTVSAGAYVLERSLLDLLEHGRRASIERDVFPRLVGNGLYGRVGEGYWLDIGTPERYLQGTFDILEGVVSTGVQERLGEGHLAVAAGVEDDGRVLPAAIVEDGCVIGDGARVGGRVMLGRDVSVGAHTTVESAVVLDGAVLGDHCVIRHCVVGPGARIGDGCHVDGLAMLGEGVNVGADNVLVNGARLSPGVTLPDGALKF